MILAKHAIENDLELELQGFKILKVNQWVFLE
jgi:hypothetical protein